MSLSSSMTQQIVFPFVGKSARFLLFVVFCLNMSIDRHNYCRDPFKKHRRRVYVHLRVASENLIAEHPSLSLRSGDLLCVNCLKAAQKNDCEVAFEPAGLAVFPRNVLSQLLIPQHNSIDFVRANFSFSCCIISAPSSV